MTSGQWREDQGHIGKTVLYSGHVKDDMQ